MTKTLAIFAGLAMALAPAVFAGWEYTSVSHGEAGQNHRMMDITVKAWVEGSKARVDFVQSRNPLLRPGTYLVTKDGGKTVSLVDPEAKTYAPWDMQNIAGAAGDAMKMMGMKFANPKVETLLAENGGVIAGLPSKHYRLRTSYNLEMSLFGLQQSTATVRDDELWTTTELKDSGLGLWLNERDLQTGNDELDRMIQDQAARLDGFPLKRISTTTSKDSKGHERVTKMSTEVTEIRKSSPDAALFEIPADYAQQAPFLSGGTTDTGGVSATHGGQGTAELLKRIQSLKQNPR